MATPTISSSAQKKGNATTEVIIGSAAAKLTAGVAQLNAAAEVIKGLATQSSNLAIEITSREDRVAQLDIEFKEKKRSKEVELALEVQADRVKVVDAYVKEHGKVLLSQDEVDRQNDELSTLKSNFSEEVSKGINAATANMKRQHESELALKDAQFRAQEAENKSRITSLEQQLESAREETKRAWTALDEERKAGVQRAQAQGQATVNVGTPSNGR